MPFIIPYWVHFAAMAVVLAAAVWRGDGLVRLAAAYNAANNASVFFASAVSHDGAVAAVGGAAVDLAFYLSLALRGRRYWTLAAASIALVNAVTCVLQLVLRVAPWAFGTALLVWFYALNTVIVLAACRTPDARRPSAQSTGGSAGVSQAGH